jgi:hypothetical protein
MFLGYNYGIMKRWILRNRWFLLGIALFVGAIVFVACQQKNAAEKYKRHRAEYCAALMATAEQKKACTEETASAKDYLPWGYELVAWPEGIGAWILILTGAAIGWQGWETRKAADATKDTVEAIKGQSALMKKQADVMERTMILQFRPRIIVRSAIAKHFEVEWGKVGRCNISFHLANAGGSSAFIIGGHMQLLSCVGHNSHDVTIDDGEPFKFTEFVLTAGEYLSFQETLTTGALMDTPWIDFFQGGPDTYRYLYLIGSIWYRDDLGIPRQTNLHRKFEFSSKRFVPQKDNEEENSD